MAAATGSLLLSAAWTRSGWSVLRCASVLRTTLPTSTPHPWLLHQYRHGSFFNKLTAEELWRGVLAESGAGARKGRGKRTKRRVKKDLNRGQMVGEGRAGFLWPGLNAPVVKSGTIQSIGKREQKEQEDLRARAQLQQDEWDKRRKMKVKRERGWTGRSWGGISVGPPDPGPNGETYEDFNSRVIEVFTIYKGLLSLNEEAMMRSDHGRHGPDIFEVKSVFNMTAKEGRKRSISALVVVGNGNGAAGFALGKAPDRPTALRKAKNRAIHYLHFIERYNDHTVYHDITSRFKRTTINIKKQNYGHGLHCHRAIITICKLIGIKDMYAKVIGSTNLLNLTRALFQGLSKQETHSDLAERKGLHVVEFRGENGPLPLVVASPGGAVRKEGESQDEIADTKLDWREVKAAQGMKQSVWANVKRTIW